MSIQDHEQVELSGEGGKAQVMSDRRRHLVASSVSGGNCHKSKEAIQRHMKRSAKPVAERRTAIHFSGAGAGHGHQKRKKRELRNLRLAGGSGLPVLR